MERVEEDELFGSLLEDRYVPEEERQVIIPPSYLEGEIEDGLGDFRYVNKRKRRKNKDRFRRTDEGLGMDFAIKGVINGRAAQRDSPNRSAINDGQRSIETEKENREATGGENLVLKEVGIDGGATDSNMGRNNSGDEVSIETDGQIQIPIQVGINDNSLQEEDDEAIREGRATLALAENLGFEEINVEEFLKRSYEAFLEEGTRW